jgi:transcriptional regulator with XRE-family HTH domain
MANHPVDIRVGQRIRNQRVLAGMSQTDLAQALGVTFQQVQKYEKGVNRVSASRMQMMAAAFRVPVAHFFDNGEMSQPDPMNLTSEGMTLTRAFSRLRNPRLKRAIIELIEAFAEV